MWSVRGGGETEEDLIGLCGVSEGEVIRTVSGSHSQLVKTVLRNNPAYFLNVSSL